MKADEPPCWHPVALSAQADQPCARQGHSAVVGAKQQLFIFGGDLGTLHGVLKRHFASPHGTHLSYGIARAVLSIGWLLRCKCALQVAICPTSCGLLTREYETCPMELSSGGGLRPEAMRLPLAAATRLASCRTPTAYSTCSFAAVGNSTACRAFSKSQQPREPSRLCRLAACGLRCLRACGDGTP